MTQTIPQTPSDYDHTSIVERPDGFYWQEKGTTQEYGPFESLIEAAQDMRSAEETSYEPGESVEEAEAELGISDWTDPDTGELSEEERPRIRDDH